MVNLNELKVCFAFFQNFRHFVSKKFHFLTFSKELNKISRILIKNKDRDRSDYIAPLKIIIKKELSLQYINEMKVYKSLRKRTLIIRLFKKQNTFSLEN